MFRVSLELRLIAQVHVEMDDVVVGRPPDYDRVVVPRVVGDRPVDEAQGYGGLAVDDGDNTFDVVDVGVIERAQGMRQQSAPLVHPWPTTAAATTVVVISAAASLIAFCTTLLVLPHSF